MKIVKYLLVYIVLLPGMPGIAQEIKSLKAIELEKIIKENNRPLIIDFWATWCKPCLEDMPVLIKEVNEQNRLAKKATDSIQLVLVSLDLEEEFPAGLSSFVKKRKIKAKVMWLDETNADYFCPKVDPNWSGAIPATLFVNNQTGYRKFFEEKISKQKLKEEIMAILNVH